MAKQTLEKATIELMPKKFNATIEIIGINPFVFVPESILSSIFNQADKHTSPISVKGTIDGHAFIQTLVKYKGHWHLYINGPMIKACSKNIGQQVQLTLEFDPETRAVPLHPKLQEALNQNKKALTIFQSLRPSLQKEIKRYINALKTQEAIDTNVKRAIQFLLGKERFIGRKHP